MDNISPVGSIGPSALEEMYQSFLEDRDSVDKSWQQFFAGFELARKSYPEKAPLRQIEGLDKEFTIHNLIHAYRQRGHLFTKTNPVRTRRKYLPTLDIENFGLGKPDLGKTFRIGTEIGIGPAKLKDIIQFLEDTYCQSVGVEYVYMRNPELVKWLQQKMESTRNSHDFSEKKRKHIFYHLKLAVGFENFIHKKFVGQKRFSLEGAETLIPSLDAVIEHGAGLGISEFIIGMAHRGRLNVLANIMQKPYENIFKEFYGKEYEDDIELGDVKYHLGYENVVTTDSGKKVNLKLMPNPSHLEAVAPLVQGMVRSRIDSIGEGGYQKVAPIIIHGDAAIAAQGVVYEVIQMSQLDGYKTGGTIHLIINNQVGFTTNYLDARSSTYCTDVAKVTRSPVFHVNGDDVEALIYTVRLAMEFRQEFHNDVFIDILCYRKYGHNEGDEPRFTQPLLYKYIAKHPNPRDIYSEKLAKLNILSKEEGRKEISDFDKYLEGKYNDSKKIDKLKIREFLLKEYAQYEKPSGLNLANVPETGVSRDILTNIANKILEVPEGKSFFKKVTRILSDRRMMVLDGRLDWAMGELLAYGSLVNEGHRVRVSGQDSERGTFAHRHASFVFEDSDKKYFPLKNVSEGQAPFYIYNSLLSEYGVLGFEYGYAMAQPNGLTIWEAQFGDFHNVAQVIIDQFIASAYEKWGLMNGLVLFLPHGYEGQGPEHSSARIERFLTLAANNNMQVVVPTTPANMFHLLRRQVKWKVRIPLIVFTPKSLLRHPMVVSKMEDFTHGAFRELIDDHYAKPQNIERLVFVSGRLYYDLAKRKLEEGAENIALVRVEQLYPIPARQIEEVVEKYSTAKSIIWVQDEPENQGAWPFIHRKLGYLGIKVVARPETASPAGGLLEKHLLRRNRILDTVFTKKEI
ncbi:2-oxoglutarate dehydrogenase E1 component [hydrothermal vent metagenome]|uniref:oxoglutarate dehydrogenase (succinyl-transferring) n=1 Tax=hydrothermal vent metagenome TaxID=652676 RepID=A0A3B0U8W0_9ZZZZ